MMYSKFDIEHWNKDKLEFADEIDINVDLMNELSSYFFGFTNAPVFSYGKGYECFSLMFYNTDALKDYVKYQYNNNIKTVLYCILTRTFANESRYVLRFASIPN